MFSDMMNWTDNLIMEESNTNFNYNTIDKCLENVPNVELTKTTVIIITGEQVESSAEHYKLVKSFWSKYFDKNQIKLYDYNSASVSKLNELMLLEVNQDL